MDLAGRDDFEKEIARRLGRISQQQYRRLVDALGKEPTQAQLDAINRTFWQELETAYQGALQPELEKVFTAHALALIAEQSIGIDVAVINERAARWAREYSYQLVRGITDSTRTALQQQIAGFFEDKRTLGDLYESIGQLFGPVRAEMIAVTETTRAAVQGELAFADELGKLGLHTTQIWQTNNDDLVCPICGPLNQMRRGDGWNDPPPAHPRCRCWTSTEVIAA